MDWPLSYRFSTDSLFASILVQKLFVCLYATSVQDGALNTRKSFVTGEHVKNVRSRLTPDENDEVDEGMLNQFLRATKQDVEKVRSPWSCQSRFGFLADCMDDASLRSQASILFNKI